jgi:hypothetical protein
MLKRYSGLWLGTICYLGLCSGLCAIPFCGEFAASTSRDAGSQWPLMHASVVEFMSEPAVSASVKE